MDLSVFFQGILFGGVISTVVLYFFMHDKYIYDLKFQTYELKKEVTRSEEKINELKFNNEILIEEKKHCLEKERELMDKIIKIEEERYERQMAMESKD